MQEIEGLVENIIFKNESNGYCVLELNLGDEEESTVVVGSFYDVNEGSYIRAKGEYTEHLIYGRQFKADTYEAVMPQDLDSIKTYLASGAVPYVRAALATKIIAEFGEKSLDIMENDPVALSTVKGISLKRAKEISVVLQQNSKQRQAVIFMQSYGITGALAIKIYEKYSDKIYDIIQTNPYALAEGINGVGFKIADSIAFKAGIDKNSDVRILSGILYALKNAAINGHTYLPIELLRQSASALLDINIEEISEHILSLSMDKKLIVKKNEEEVRAYLPNIFYMEQNIAFMLCDLNLSFSIDEQYYRKKIKEIEKEDNIVPDENQTNAMIKALRSGLLVITGGPGTGKTTVLKAIIKLFEHEGYTVSLAAPTGRAAKRMAEATKRDALTIHRLLEVRGADSGLPVMFERNKSNPLESDVIIVDELSMVDIPLMYNLLQAIPIGCRLILTGDADQLPSVGVGNVLKDIIRSESIEVCVLNKIFRQSQNSNIVVMAHSINAGRAIEPKTLGADFVFLERNDINKLKLTLLTMIKNKLPKALSLSPFDIQVLCPMKKGPVGVEEMNKLLQYHLNPQTDSKKEHRNGDILYREGDKVMQIKNNYQIDWEIRSESGFIDESGNGIFNGDLGRIITINEYSASMTVCFDDNKYVEYPFVMLEQLDLAYAATVHKSQGSEYNVVLLPLFAGSRLLMTRNILYTAITRAKSCICIIGKASAFTEMIENIGDFRRYSSLHERIREAKAVKENN